MINVKKNLVLFGAGVLVLTTAMRFGISRLLDVRQFGLVWGVVAVYAVGVFLLGWVLGRREHKVLPLRSIGLRFHVITYLVCNGVAVLWFQAGLQSMFEKAVTVHRTVLFWGIGLLLHVALFLLTRKKSIRGISRDELFE